VRNTERYKIGEVAHMLGITPEAVRYYEKQGIINPEKNPISGYRYYSAWDINMLVRARTYRQQGFSMKEVVDIMGQFEPSETIAYLAEKEQVVHDKIQRAFGILNQLRDDQAILRDAISGHNKFAIQYRPSMHFLQSQVGYDIISSHRDLYELWTQKYAAFVLPGGIYEGPRSEDVAYGFFVEDSKLGQVGFRNEEEIRVVPSCLCLATSFLSGSDSELSRDSFQFAFDYIDEQGLEIIGDPVSRIVLMAKEEKCYRSLHKLWIPVKGDRVEVQESADEELFDLFENGGEARL
jgi:DNA-binding transcriptional MerR regulator